MKVCTFNYNCVSQGSRRCRHHLSAVPEFLSCRRYLPNQPLALINDDTSAPPGPAHGSVRVLLDRNNCRFFPLILAPWVCLQWSKHHGKPPAGSIGGFVVRFRAIFSLAASSPWPRDAVTVRAVEHRIRGRRPLGTSRCLWPVGMDAPQLQFAPLLRLNSIGSSSNEA